MLLSAIMRLLDLFNAHERSSVQNRRRHSQVLCKEEGASNCCALKIELQFRGSLPNIGMHFGNVYSAWQVVCSLVICGHQNQISLSKILNEICISLN